MQARLITALAISGALALAGCSSPSPSTTAGGATAATKAAASIDGTEFGAHLTDAMVGAKSGKATITLDPSGAAGGTAAPGATAPITVTSEFVFNSAKQMNVHATYASSGKSQEVVVVDGITYQKLPTPAGGKTWARSAGQDSAGAADPLAIAKSFGSATVTLVGEAGGLKHYTVTAIAGQTGTSTEIYVDGAGRPAKIVAVTSGIKVSAEYTDWGAPVTVTAPPADQVVELPAGTATTG